MKDKKMTAKNYHNEEETFQTGNPVIHVSDDGSEFKGIIKEISGELLHIAFEDGEDGWELASTCYTQ